MDTLVQRLSQRYRIPVIVCLLLVSVLAPSVYAQASMPPEPGSSIVADDEEPPVPTAEPDGSGEFLPTPTPEPELPADQAPRSDTDATLVEDPEANSTDSTMVEESLPAVDEQKADETPSAPLEETGDLPETDLPEYVMPLDSGPLAVQGEVTIDVVVSPERIKAGNEIKYTYRFKNNGSQTRNNIIIEAIWVHYSDKSWQFCGTDQCAPFAITSGLSVTQLASCPANILRDVQENSRKCYQIAALGQGVAGEFSVKLLTRPELYPQTAREPIRPSGSARLYLEGASNRISEDTASALIEGPVFVLKKAPVSTAKIYPLETTEFVITLGNATNPGDQIGGQRREDAIAAQNPVLVDTWPAGSELVTGSVTGGGVVDATARTITWKPGRLDPGQTREFRARFKKLDVNQECERLANNTYNVTSDEMPIRTGTTRYLINGVGASVSVVTPLAVKSISWNPGNVIYGEESTATIVVQNFYNQAVSGGQLKYVIQSNTAYIPGSASNTAPNTLISAPSGADLGGTVLWNLNMPAGSITAPSEVSYTLRVRGSFTSQVAGGTGVAQITAPGNIPAACIRTRDGRVGLSPRLVVSKLSYKGTSFEYVDRYSDFTYVITIQNKAATIADNVTIADKLPRNDRFPANFSYVEGSATLDGVARAPNSVVNGNGGMLVWNEIDIPAGATLTLRYTMHIDGYEYVDYTNTVGATLAQENITYANRSVRVKINPPIRVTKSVNKTQTNIAGDTVQFTLHLQNESPNTYEVGLYDRLGAFSYVSQVSGYGQPSQVNGNNLAWPVVSVAPGGTLDAVITARLPNECLTRTYVNEILFLFKTNGEIGIVQPVPSVKASVELKCGTNKIEYSKSADRSTISLKDQVVYSLNVKNANTVDPISNITVIDVLPEGFSYVGMASGSTVTTAPQQQTRKDGRIQLTWQISSLAANQSAKVVFTALGGNIAGPFDNWLRATAPNLLEAKCTGRCLTVDDNGEVFNYSYAQVLVQPLITMEPTINDQACAKPGDKRNYRLSIVNTNTHSYVDTKVSVTLPIGLSYIRPLNGTTSPTMSRTANGDMLLVWQNMTIPAKPKDKTSALVVLEVEIEAGQTWRNMPTKVEVTSSSGLIPLKDGVLNPIVRMCPATAAVAKIADRSSVSLNDTYVYEIAVVNPNTAAALTISLSDELPSNVVFVENLLGPAPSVQGKTLTWTNLKVDPATDENNLGELLLRFKVRAVSGNVGDTIVNTINVTSSDPTGVNIDRSTSTVKLVKRSVLYLPSIAR